MPGPGIFKIGDSVPVVTRIGVETFDKEIKGPPGGFGSEIATISVADQSFGSVMGLFQKCVGVAWGGLAFEFEED